MSCVPPFPDAAVHAFHPAPAPAPLCGALHVEVAGQGAIVLPDESVSRTIDLARARVGLGLASGPVWVRLRTTMTRSADEDSYIGIAEEAWVPVVDQAVLGGTLRGFSGELGIVADPWVSAGNRAWLLDALTPTFAEWGGWIAPSDLGVEARWTGLGGRLDARALLTNGEGANRRERNEGKDVTGMVSVAPLATPALVLSAYGRNGSRGLGYVPAHRVGARIAGETDRVAYGVEGLLVWGVDDDASRAPVGGSAWARVRPYGPLVIAARGDLTSEALDDPDALTLRGLAAAGVGVDVGAGTLFALVGADHVTRGDAVAPVSGTALGADATRLFLHVGIELDAHLSR